MARFTDLLVFELKRRLRDPVSLVTWLAIPFFMVAVMVLVFGPGGTNGLPQMKVLLVDHDDGLLSRALSSALDSPQLAEYFDVRKVDEKTAKHEMDRGRASLLVVIPEGFTKGFFDNAPLTIQVFRNPQESILPQIGEEVVTFLADSGGLLRAVLQPLTAGVIDLGADQRPTLAQITDLSSRIYKLFDDPAARNLTAFDHLKVEERHPGEKKVSRSDVVGWFAPGIVALALLFLTNGQSQEVQEDLISGRLARAWTSATPPAVPVAAKYVALVLAASVNTMFLVAALAGVLGWRPGNPALVAAQIVATAAAFSGLALLLRSLTRNPEAGGAAASGVMVGLGFLGGCFVPTIFLPSFVQTAADLIPTGWAVKGFLILEGATWAGAGGGFGWRIAALLATAVASFLIAARLMRREAVAV
jgi:ABC-type multidrug transport system permease subunit